jgi:hypothetical protein
MNTPETPRMDAAFRKCGKTPRMNWQASQCYEEGCKLERELASERARADHELKERCKMAIDRNFLKLALDTERALADRLASALTDSVTWSHALPAYEAWKEARRE